MVLAVACWPHEKTKPVFLAAYRLREKTRTGLPAANGPHSKTPTIFRAADPLHKKTLADLPAASQPQLVTNYLNYV